MGLFLTGGGEQEFFKEIDRYFISQLEAPAKILLIPQAIDEELYDETMERIEEVFQSKFIQQIDLLSNPEDLTLDQVLSYQALVLEGGNTFQLVDSIRESSFFNHMKAFGATGKPIYADSAGAILLGCDVETAFLGDEGDEDHLKLQDYRGLDLIPPWSIHAHYEPEDFESLEQILYDKGSPIIALAEPSAVYIEGETILSMGVEPVELITFSGREVLHPGEKFTLL